MIETCHKKVDFTCIEHDVGLHLTIAHARWLRGSVACRIRRPEFHQHGGEGIIYRHPLIRYDVSTGHAEIAGLAEGALLLRSIPAFDAFELGRDRLRVRQRSIRTERVTIGPSADLITYVFHTPYLALNQENFQNWEGSNEVERKRLLSRIVVGTQLSLCKAIGLHVAERFRPKWTFALAASRRSNLVSSCWASWLVTTNFQLPGRWGIGKSSSRGFGTLTVRENQNG